MTIEYRICWEASSNISFQGSTDWEEWGGYEETGDQVMAKLNKATGGMLPQGFEEALQASGFGWWAETRTTAGEA